MLLDETMYRCHREVLGRRMVSGILCMNWPIVLDMIEKIEFLPFIQAWTRATAEKYFCVSLFAIVRVTAFVELGCSIGP